MNDPPPRGALVRALGHAWAPLRRRVAPPAGPLPSRAALRDARAHAGAPEATAALALVTHHFVPERLCHLAGALAAFEAWPSARRVALVVTNVADPAALAAIHAAAPARPRPGFAVEVVTAPPCEDPHDLPWAQKPLLRDRFLAARAGFTHLVALEDDMAVGPEAFLYWLRHREPLARQGLVPSFMRVEPRPGDGLLMATDALAPNLLDGRARARAGAHDFVALDNPYCALFVLDRALAAEYAASRSFDRLTSRALTPWPTRERAAMGLCWEAPPPGFPTRFVVPIDAAARGVARAAWVRHLPANYAADPDSPFARCPAAEVLR